MGEHTFCRHLYGVTCRDLGIKQNAITVYRYVLVAGWGHKQHYQIYHGDAIMGDYTGCCAYDAKTRYLDHLERERERHAEAVAERREASNIADLGL